MSEIWKILFIKMLVYAATEAQNVWKEVDTLNHVVTFYDKKGDSYDTAKSFCSNLPGETQIVQLDDTFVRDAVYENIADSSNAKYFWIGAERDTTFDCPNASNCKWNWVNGSSVDMSKIIWYAGQPDNSGGNENNMIIRKSDNKFGDITDNFNLAGIICQKRRDTSRYKLTIYDEKASNWNEAVQKCSDINATLVQLDDDDVREEVYASTGSASVDYFWIGATGACYDWTWLDGEPVAINLPWYENQPDDTNNKENKLMIRSNDNMFGDVGDDFSYAGIVCQTNFDCSDNPDICIHGTCKTESSTCDCEPGYYGYSCQNCKENANVCVHGECSTDGLCVCSSGYIGDMCQNCKENLNVCVHGKCGTDGLCVCSPGFFGDNCQNCHENLDICIHGTCEPLYTRSFFNTDKYNCNNCDRHTETRQGTGNCPAFPPTDYKCNCSGTGYFGDTCQYDFCDSHPNPCKNGGECTFTPDHEPFYKCNCTDTGYDGDFCDFGRDLLLVKSSDETIGVVGEAVNIDVNITTFDEQIIVEMYKDDKGETPVDTKYNVGNGTTTFSFHITSTNDEGTYIFVAYPESKLYYRQSSTYLLIHVGATIHNLSHLFIFSPMTNGSSEVKCSVDGIPTPDVAWFTSTSESVSTTNEYGVYQIVEINVATLHVENAVPTDDGNYTCIALNVVGENSILGFDNEVIQLAVYGSPIIVNIETMSCSAQGILSIEWQPDVQTTKVTHRFEVESLNSTTQVKKIKYETYKSNSYVIFDNLDPSTAYKILVEVCPNQCITKLSDVRTQTTGIGLPEKVQRFYVEKNEDSQHCIVTWDWPESPNDQIIDYEIFVEAELVYIPADSETKKIVNKMVTTIKPPGLIYAHETEPNTDYTFYITARSCAGSGETVKATGSCITKYSAPNQVPKPIISLPSKAGSTREITIPLADETNGPISCSFVIVNRGDFINTNRSFDIEQLEDASNAALSDNFGVDYLAIAIPREYMTSKIYTTNLGDGRTTNCDVSKILTTSKQKQKNTVANSFMYLGKNWPLKTDGTEYTFYIVTSTPVDNEQFILKSGPVQIFINGSSSQAWIAGVVVGVIFFVSVVVVICVYLYKRKTKKRPEETNEPAYEVYDINKGYDNIIVNEDHLPQDITVNGEESPYEEVRRDQDYENAGSINE